MYFRTTLDRIFLACSERFQRNHPAFNTAFSQCLESVGKWCVQTRAQQFAKLPPNLELLYEYTYDQAFQEFCRRSKRIKYRPAEIQIRLFEDFFNALLDKVCQDRRFRSADVLNMAYILQFKVIVAEHIRAVLCDSLEHVTCTEEALRSYLHPVLSVENLRKHDEALIVDTPVSITTPPTVRSHRSSSKPLESVAKKEQSSPEIHLLYEHAED